MFDNFKARMRSQGSYMGQVLKNQSDVIMDATFKNDVAFRVCYLQDKDTIFPEQTLAGYKKARAVYAGKENYDMSELKGFSPVDCKYLVKSYYSISGDTIDYYLQFRPNAHGTNPNIRVGAFVFVPDDLGVYNLWLIVARDDKPQFPQFYILKCDFIAKWYISHDDVVRYEGVHIDVGTYYSWCVARIQSSYNSGIWTDYTTTSPENQRKLWFPTNSDSQTLIYNEHVTISENPYRRTSWEVTKYVDSEPRGLVKLTLAQQMEYSPRDNLTWVNTHTDIISNTQHGSNYDFYEPRKNDQLHHSPVDIDESVISFSGVKPSLKVGGSYKTFTVNFVKNGQTVQTRPHWSIDYIADGKKVCSINFTNSGNSIIPHGAGIEVSNDRKITYGDNFGLQYTYSADAPDCLKIRCLSNVNMIDNKLIITARDNSTLSATLEVEVASL